MAYFRKMFYNKVCTDVVLNISSSMILIGALQIFVYPGISKICSAEEYGLFLTLIGVANLLSGTFGNSLNNVRLIMHQDYCKLSVIGDFNILLFGGLIIEGIVVVGYTIFITDDFGYMLLVLALILFMTIRQYNSVAFRLEINFFKIFMLNMILASSYVVMIFVYKYQQFNHRNWIYIFLIAELLAAAFLVHNNCLWREALKKTKLWKKTLINYLNVIFLSFADASMMYLDRNLLLPLLGGKAVATYFVATVVGKAVNIIVGPISSVILSYFAQVGFVMNRKKFWIMNGAIGISSIIAYIITITIVHWVAYYFYPTLYNDAKEYFYLANVVPCLGAINALIQPAVLKYVPMKRQCILRIVILLLSVSIGYYVIFRYGIYGFCLAAICLEFFRMVCFCVLGHIALRDSGGNNAG